MFFKYCFTFLSISILVICCPYVFSLEKNVPVNVGSPDDQSSNEYLSDSEDEGLSTFDIPFDKKWRLMEYKKNKPTKFSIQNNILQIKSHKAVAFYHYNIPFMSNFAHCTWRVLLDWRVLNAKNITTQKTKESDDRPLAIHVWLNDPSQYGWFKGGLASLFSLPTPGDMLTYSWGLNEELGQSFPNPHLPERAHISVLRSENDIGEAWHHESISVSEDISNILGKKVGKKGMYLAISADTEDSLGESYAEVKNIKIVTDQCDHSPK